MKLPSLKQAGGESIDTLARIAGATAGKLTLGTISKKGLLYSMLLFFGGLVIAISGPDKFKLKQMGEGLAMYGGLKVINDLSQPTIDWGLGSATPNSLAAIALPESVRNILNSYVPSIDGLAGYGMTVYPANYPQIPANNANYTHLNGNVPPLNLPIPSGNAQTHIQGVGNVPVVGV